MSSLAINSGEKYIKRNFEIFNFIGKEEIAATTEVLESGMLSKFVGDWEPDFYGGSRVQGLKRHGQRILVLKRNISKFLDIRFDLCCDVWISNPKMK